jgi:hypothetical protein
MPRSPDYVKLSNAGRVAWFSLISQADDFGRLQGFDAHHLAATYCAPGTSDEEVAGQLDVMESLGMIRKYGGRSGDLYTALLQWPAHQRVDHPTNSRIPEPPISKPRRRLATIREGSRALASRVRPRTGSEGTGPDRTGSPPKGPPVGEADVLTLVPPVSLSPVEQVFEAWRQRWHQTAKLTGERRSKIEARFRDGWSLEDLIEAVTTGLANDSWAERHLALNDDIKILLRNGSSVEKFVGLAKAPPTVLLPASRSRAGQLDRVYAEAQARAREEDR